MHKFLQSTYCHYPNEWYIQSIGRNSVLAMLLIQLCRSSCTLLSESNLVEEACSRRHYEAFLAKQNGIVTGRGRLFSVLRIYLIKTTLVKSLERCCSVVVKLLSKQKQV